MLTLSKIRRQLAPYSPVRLPSEGCRIASVGVVLREVDDRPEVLFIERATHSDDPWSGHIAFPGGRMEPEDACERATAERETREEVGVGLADASYLGRLDDMTGLAAAARNLVVTAHVYHKPEPEPLVPNYEVASAFWFPLADLHDRDRYIDYTVPIGGREIGFPGIVLGDSDDLILWGLTYRFIELFMEILEHPIEHVSAPR